MLRTPERVKGGPIKPPNTFAPRAPQLQPGLEPLDARACRSAHTISSSINAEYGVTQISTYTSCSWMILKKAKGNTKSIS